MWDEFYEDIDGKEFATRKEYELYVQAWVQGTIDEAGRIERWGTGLPTEMAQDELNIKILKP